MSQKSAAFMSPQAAIAKGRENSKGWKKSPMKLIYNFDAHKKTASEGMFFNPSSEIPDELWRAPTPMQRQADAVVLWAELTGKHASGCGSHGPAKPKKKTVKKASAEKDLSFLRQRARLEAERLSKSTPKITPERIAELESKKLGPAGFGPGHPKQMSRANPRMRAALQKLDERPSAKRSLSPSQRREIESRADALFLRTTGHRPRPALSKKASFDPIGIGRAREGLREIRERQEGREMGLPDDVSADELKARLADIESIKKVQNPRLAAALMGATGAGMAALNPATRNPLGIAVLSGGGALGGALGTMTGHALTDRTTIPYVKRLIAEKSASTEKTARNEHFVNALHAIRNNPELAGAAVGAPLGAGKAYLDYRPSKSGISKAEASLMGKLEEARAMKADKKKIDKLKKHLEAAKSRRENLGRTVAMGAGIGGTAGAGMMHMAARQRGLRGK